MQIIRQILTFKHPAGTQTIAAGSCKTSHERNLLTIECDLHLHSIRSTCGFHTLLEIVEIIRKQGLKGFALTDHGPALGTPTAHFSVLLRRFPDVIDGLRVIKGIETSVLNCSGDVDMPVLEGNPYEIVLAGLHSHDLFYSSQGKEKNTRALINSMKKHPEIKILSHPCFKSLPVDIDALTDVALETGTALEINSSRLNFGRVEIDRLSRMTELASEKGTMLAVNSDGHGFAQMGNFTASLDFLEPFGMDNLNIVNRTLEETLSFLGLDC